MDGTIVRSVPDFFFSFFLSHMRHICLEAHRDDGRRGTHVRLGYPYSYDKTHIHTLPPVRTRMGFDFFLPDGTDGTDGAVVEREICVCVSFSGEVSLRSVTRNDIRAAKKKPCATFFIFELSSNLTVTQKVERSFFRVFTSPSL